MKKPNFYISTFLACAMVFSNVKAQSNSEQLALAKTVASTTEKLEPNTKKPALPNVVILATGGTIAGAAATGTQAGYTSGQVTIDAMLNAVPDAKKMRSEEHTSELQSQSNLVCRLLLEKKKK